MINAKEGFEAGFIVNIDILTVEQGNDTTVEINIDFSLKNTKRNFYHDALILNKQQTVDLIAKLKFAIGDH